MILAIVVCSVVFIVLSILLLVLEQIGISKFKTFVYREKKLKNVTNFEFKNLEEKSY